MVLPPSDRVSVVPGIGGSPGASGAGPELILVDISADRDWLACVLVCDRHGATGQSRIGRQDVAATTEDSRSRQRGDRKGDIAGTTIEQVEVWSRGVDRGGTRTGRVGPESGSCPRPRLV